MPNHLHADLFRSDPAIPREKPHSRQSQLGQFMTPSSVSRFMAGLFENPFPDTIRLLDAGAGHGELTLAFIAEWNSRSAAGKILAHAFELDAVLIDELQKRFSEARKSNQMEIHVFHEDFIEHAANMIRLGKGLRYTHAILNPPYKKINSSSLHRTLLRAAGLETVNLYSAFVGLAVAMLQDGGEIVAIIPRSFCNGPYYEPFRRYILDRAAILHIHLFQARDKAFKNDGVLQENIIIHLKRGSPQKSVSISLSTDDTFSDYVQKTHEFSHIVFPGDAKRFIHIPSGEDVTLLEAPSFCYRLDELGLSVSTGPVVDFRMKDDLRADPEPGTVPLLYPGHFLGDRLEWPKAAFKKPNAIRHTRATDKWLFPSGFYAVVRRFSSKEERRRIVASVVDPAPLNARMIGFENHLNVIHENRQPLSEDIARGIALYLNATPVDQYFRRFNGHTQVNATDLRTMPYPSREALHSLGAWAKQHAQPTQDAIDARVRRLA